jgi:hypothetical protein
MITQNDLFAPANEIIDSEDISQGLNKALTVTTPIAVPCGFRDRRNSPCRRLGNWPVMSEGKQMVCRDRPMVHCDAACFDGEAPARQYGTDNDDIVWDDRTGPYGDE